MAKYLDKDGLTYFWGKINDRLEEDEAARITKDNECYIFISDSYGGTYGNSSGDDTTIWSLLESKFNMPNRLYFCTFTACGFINTTGGGTFLTKLQNEASSIASAIDISKVTKVIVVAGRNDYIADNANATFSAMQSFDSYVKTTYPNAKRYYGFIAGGNNTSAGDKASLITKSYAAYRRCNEFGGIYLNGVESAIHVNGGLGTDGIHPSSTGKYYIANAIYEAIETGSYIASFPPVTVTPIANSSMGFSFVGSYELHLSEIVENNSLYIFSGDTIVGLTSQNGSTFTQFHPASINIATYSGGYLTYPFGDVAIPIILHISTDDIPAKIVFSVSGNVYLRFYPNKTYTGITSYLISPVDSRNVWPIVYC